MHEIASYTPETQCAECGATGLNELDSAPTGDCWLQCDNCGHI